MKRLAIDGGTPVREKKISYGHQLIDKDDISAVNEVLKSDSLTCGPKLQEAQERLCQYTGAKHAVLVNSGTSALHCACIAAGIGPGDEVITTPLTFAASSNCVLYCGGIPVFADVDPDTYSISPEDIERKITSRTKAVIAVDYTGQAVRIDEIKEICDRNGLIFIEDAAHSIGTQYKGRQIGSLADMTCFSFHPVKTITSGEGGAILTNDDSIYKKLLMARSHGITHDIQEMVSNRVEGPWYYEMLSLGYNYRMTDIQAALLISQLNKIETFKKRRSEIAKRYDEAFSDIPGIILQRAIPESDTCRHLYVLRLDKEKISCSRRLFFESLLAENVQPQVHYIPVYLFPFYRQKGYEPGLCPVAEDVYSGILSIPLYPAMSDYDVNSVIEAVEKVTYAYLKTE